MTHDQTLRLAKAVKAVCTATSEMVGIASELLADSPSTGLKITGPVLEIDTANNKVLDVVKESFNKLNIPA